MYPAPGAIGERRPVDKPTTRHSILLRKLPSNSDREAVRNILLFAKDLIDCELLPQPRHADDKGFASAIAHFQTFEGAKEARDLLNGKRNATNDATLVVELMHEAPPPRRRWVASQHPRQHTRPSSLGRQHHVHIHRQRPTVLAIQRHLSKHGEDVPTQRDPRSWQRRIPGQQPLLADISRQHLFRQPQFGQVGHQRRG